MGLQNPSLNAGEEIEARGQSDRSASMGEEFTSGTLAVLPKAGFWLRGGAFIVDAILVVVLAIIGGFLVGVAVQVGGELSGAPEFALELLELAATAVLSLLISAGYFILFVVWRGQTPGKLIFRLKVIRITGENLGFGRALLRWYGQVLSFLLLGLGFLLAAISRRKQALHDKLAGTIVVRLPP
jgi:uncharacterized RDD family membrane protein YckC